MILALSDVWQIVVAVAGVLVAAVALLWRVNANVTSGIKASARRDTTTIDTLNRHTETLDDHEARLRRNEQDSHEMRVAMTRLDENVGHMRKSIDRLVEHETRKPQ